MAHHLATALVTVGILAGSATVALAAPVTLLDEDFSDVSGLVATTTVRTVAAILGATPSELPAGTAVDNAATINVRRSDNVIDDTVGNNGFDNFFTGTGATSGFLVLGDSIGNINGDNVGTVNFSVLLTLPAFTTGITIAYDFVFDTNDAVLASPSPDDFLVDLLDLSDSDSVSVQAVPGPVRNVGTRGTVGASFSILDLASLGSSFRLNFRLVEFDGDNSSAVGIDNIRVIAEVREPDPNPTPIPAPAGMALLAGGMALAAALRRWA